MTLRVPEANTITFRKVMDALMEKITLILWRKKYRGC